MKRPVTFDFLLNELPKSMIVKPTVGMFYLYFDGKIVLIFRQTKKNPQHNGIWIHPERTACQFKSRHTSHHSV